jgi:hypothetical protein
LGASIYTDFVEQAVESVEFDDELRITALKSHEGEILSLHEPFNPSGISLFFVVETNLLLQLNVLGE